MGTPIPEEYGGAGFDYISHAIVAEEIGRVDSSLRGTYSVQVSLVELPLFTFGSEEQKKKYLPKLTSGEWIGCFGLTEPNAGSDPASMVSTAVKDGDDYILNGQKTWITNAGLADLAIVYAKTDRDAGARGITAFLVEKGFEGFSTKDIHDKLGLRASNTGEIFLENCRVPKESVLGEVNKGFKVALGTLDFGRYTVAAGCVGAAQGCIDICKDYAKQRIQFGKPIASFQLVQQMVADMVVECEAGRLLVYRVGDMKNKGMPNTRETSIAKYYCSEMVNRVAYKAIQIHGGYGFSGEYDVERFYRDARINTLYEGTSQIQQLIIGSFELGIRAFE
jgi:alkylation response protein AidB-like acyl-CoA dehydrogenase